MERKEINVKHRGKVQNKDRVRKKVVQEERNKIKTCKIRKKMVEKNMRMLNAEKEKKIIKEKKPLTIIIEF